MLKCTFGLSYMCEYVSGKCAVYLYLSIYRGSYMNAHVILNLLNELRKSDKVRGLTSILSFFRNEFN